VKARSAELRRAVRKIRTVEEAARLLPPPVWHPDFVPQAGDVICAELISALQAGPAAAD
jgi:hypothetical protein